MSNRKSLIGGICLIAGTTIGAAMLALPISTGLAGYIPAIALFLAAWVLMTYTALLMLEARLWIEGDTNLVSMARHTLGRVGEAFSWIVYLFLLYALMTSYIAGSGPIFMEGLSLIIPKLHLPKWTGALPLLGIFGYFVYRGVHSVDGINRILMVGLVLAFSTIVALGIPHADVSMLERTDWKMMSVAVSVVFTSFGYHIIIPTLLRYMEGDVVLTRRAILIGSLIPLVVYVLWETITLGIVPLEGPGGLLMGYQEGGNAAALLGDVLKQPSLSLLVRAFSFFAIVTSFLGVSLSLRDFLADGLKIEKSRRGRLTLAFLTFLPPLLISLSYPRAFLSALEYAGAYGVLALLALLPACMVWRGRYRLALQPYYRAPGGKAALLAVIAISLAVMLLELYNKTLAN